MKKKFLTLLGGALLGLFSMSATAQTDVTSTYLVNPSFEIGDVGAITSLNGWILPNLSGTYVNMSLGSSSACAGNAFGIPTPKDGDKYYFNRRGWNSAASSEETLSTTTKTELPEGKYGISVAYKALDSYDDSHNSKGSTLTLKATANDNVLGEQTITFNNVKGNNAGASKFTNGDWEILSAKFIVSSPCNVTFSIVEKLLGGVRSDVVIDNVTLVKYDVPLISDAVNLTFDEAGKAVGDVNIYTYKKDGTPAQMQEVDGWYFGVENGDARAGGQVAYGSQTTLGGSEYTAPAKGPNNEITGGALAMVGVWAGIIQYVQDVKIPAGGYTLTVKVYNGAGTSEFAKNLIGVVENNGTEHFATTKSYEVEKWTTETISFTIDSDTYGKLSLGYEGANVGSGNAQHLFVDGIVVEYTSLVEGKRSQLSELVEEAKSIVENEINVGDDAFQIPTSAKNALELAYQDADDVVKSSEDADEIQQSIDDITEAIEAYKEATLNAPSSDKRYSVKLVYDGWTYNNKAMTYIAGGRTDAGMYNIQYLAEPAAYYAQAFKFTAVEGQKNCYKMSQIDNDGKERYICTGANYNGGNNTQIRTTTDGTKALVVEVRATSTEGKWNLWNTEAGQYIGSQDAGVFTVNSHIDFALAEAPKATATLSVTDVHWGTFIAPFDVIIPEGVEAYTCSGVEGNSIMMAEVETKIPANTPVMVYSENAYSETFSEYGRAIESSYDEGNLTGVYVETQAPAGSYILMLHNDKAVFGKVVEDDEPTVGANRCYLNVPGGTSSTILRFGDATGIQSVEQQAETVIYDLTGRRVDAAVKGIYIVNGKKMLVK